jgi:hypothetical protein
MQVKFFSLLLLLFLAACANDKAADAAADKAATTEKPATPPQPADANLTGEVEAMYQNAALSTTAIMLNMLTSDNKTITAEVAFNVTDRKCKVPEDYLVPFDNPAAPGSLMPNPEMTKRQLVLVVEAGKVTEVKYK